MKKIFGIVLVFTSVVTAYSQVPQKGEYRKDDKIDKFVGVWEASRDNEVLRIVLKKEKIFVKGGLDFYWDRVVGWHSYTKNGIVVESSLDFANGTYDEHATILGGSEGDDKLAFSFRDLSRARSHAAELKLIGSDAATLTFSLKEQVLVNKKPSRPNVAMPMPPSEWKVKKIQ
jgi:hypothetical protein